MTQLRENDAVFIYPPHNSRAVFVITHVNNELRQVYVETFAPRIPYGKPISFDHVKKIGIAR
jgi:hypothetical protein